MTMEEWQATREYHSDLQAVIGDEATSSGWAYEAGWIGLNDDGTFLVLVQCDEWVTTTLVEAEHILWREWCQYEVREDA